MRSVTEKKKLFKKIYVNCIKSFGCNIYPWSQEYYDFGDNKNPFPHNRIFQLNIKQFIIVKQASIL